MERRRIEYAGESPARRVGNQLATRVIGQDEAIDSIVNAFDKARLRDSRRPVASLMFLGPTGVGKTQTAEALADILAVDKINPLLTRIDCAQYANGHEVASLVGAPPGYVGREQKPVFDKERIESPGSVVLFDEIEKGHPKLWNYLLQIMEGGKVKLMNGDGEVNFGKSVVIMTSNVGAQEMNDTLTQNQIGFAHDKSEVDASQLEAAAQGALRKRFSPEFINRLDSIVTFRSLDDEMLIDVLGSHVETSNTRYRQLGNLAVSLSEELTKHLIETAPLRREFGARPVIRNYEKKVESQLSRMALSGAVGGQYIFADYEDEQVSFYEDGDLETGTMYSIAELTGNSEETTDIESLRVKKKGRATRKL